MPGRRADDFQLQAGEPRHLRDLSQDVANTKGAMVGGALAAQGVDEGCRLQRESQPAVSVADFETLPGQGFTFRRQKFQAAVVRLGDGQDGDGTFANAGFHTPRRCQDGRGRRDPSE